MATEKQCPQTFAASVLTLLDEHFPWLSLAQDEPVSGADTMDELTGLHRSLHRTAISIEAVTVPRSRNWQPSIQVRNNDSPKPGSGSVLRNVTMIRKEPGLVAIPVEKAVYCQNCLVVSTSNWQRCGLCGSEYIVRLAPLLQDPWDPDPAPTLVLAT